MWQKMIYAGVSVVSRVRQRRGTPSVALSCIALQAMFYQFIPQNGWQQDNGIVHDSIYGTSIIMAAASWEIYLM